MGMKLLNRMFDAKRRAEIARLFVEQQRDDMLNEFDWIPGAIDLSDAGFEESEQQPVFGNTKESKFNANEYCNEGSVSQYCDWYYDGESNHESH